ncbi:MAG: PEP-CTERM sorting domain-containing protein [Marinobacter sp.]|nr:PEP-CTERM sorting domain-containing protein [Marinobacter sp.]
MNFRKTALAGGTLLATLSLSAHAAMITGDVGFGGDYTPLDSEGGSEVSLGEAGYIDVSGEEAIVTSEGTGDLAAFTEFDTVVDHQSFAVGEAPAGPLWSGNGFSFELTDMNVVAQNDVVLGLSGQGTMSAEGFEDTPFLWSFSADAAGNEEFAFSSTTTSVPEPGTLSLLGLGLLSFGVARRRMRS